MIGIFFLLSNQHQCYLHRIQLNRQKKRCKTKQTIRKKSKNSFLNWNKLAHFRGIQRYCKKSKKNHSKINKLNFNEVYIDYLWSNANEIFPFRYLLLLFVMVCDPTQIWSIFLVWLNNRDLNSMNLRLPLMPKECLNGGCFPL